VFSVGLPPPLAAAAGEALAILERGEAPLAALRTRTRAIKQRLEELGFRVLGGEHPGLAIFIGGVVPLQRMVNALYERGVHVNGVCYPVVPEGQACIRLETSVRHSEDDVARALGAFAQIGPPEPARPR
jgi:glycine C-acetyltransferase